MFEPNPRKLEELLRLMQENPQLPVLPMVEYDVVGDDDYSVDSMWLGAWGDAVKTKALDHFGQVFFYDDPYDVVLPEIYGWEYYDELDADGEREAFDALPWQDVILVRIETA